MTETRVQDAGFVQNGDLITIPINHVINQTGSLVTGVRVQLTIPAGLAFNSAVLSQGAFVAGPDYWDVGSLLPLQSVNGTITLEVVDECAFPMQVDFVTSSTSGCSACFVVDTLEVTLIAVTPCIVADAMGLPQVYAALLTQAGTAAPTVDVMQNGLSAAIVWGRTNVGIYTGTLVGAFTEDLTLIQATLGNAATAIHVTASRTSDDVITVLTFAADGTTPADLVGTLNIKVEVYSV